MRTSLKQDKNKIKIQQRGNEKHKKIKNRRGKKLITELNSHKIIWGSEFVSG